jgi:hypothetical protein
MRPFNWLPDAKGLAAAAAARGQAWIYKADTTSSHPTSEYLFYSMPGSTYYLGNLSPDGTRVSLYELNRDDNHARVGVVKLEASMSPPITWLDVPPDDARLNQPAAWTSNDELVYPIKSARATLARAAVSTGKAIPCTDCDPTLLTRSSASPPMTAESDTSATASGNHGTATGVPAGAQRIGQSPHGELTIFEVDTPEVLSLLFRKGESVQTVFENPRKLPSATQTR